MFQINMKHAVVEFTVKCHEQVKYTCLLLFTNIKVKDRLPFQNKRYKGMNSTFLGIFNFDFHHLL